MLLYSHAIHVLGHYGQIFRLVPLTQTHQRIIHHPVSEPVLSDFMVHSISIVLCLLLGLAPSGILTF